MGAGEGQFENWSGDLQVVFSTMSCMNSRKQTNDYKVVTKALELKYYVLKNEALQQCMN